MWWGTDCIADIAGGSIRAIRRWIYRIVLVVERRERGATGEKLDELLWEYSEWNEGGTAIREILMEL